MAWTAPMTAVANSVFTAAQFNTHIRDNLLMTAPALATAAGRFFASTGVNAIAERVPSNNKVSATETSGSTSYTDLATSGPAVTVTTGPTALVLTTSNQSNNTNAQNAYMSYGVTGASSVSATDDRSGFLTTAAANQGVRALGGGLETGLTAGSNTFTAKYRVTGGTGSWGNRQLIVIPF